MDGNINAHISGCVEEGFTVTCLGNSHEGLQRPDTVRFLLFTVTSVEQTELILWQMIVIRENISKQGTEIKSPLVWGQCSWSQGLMRRKQHLGPRLLPRSNSLLSLHLKWPSHDNLKECISQFTRRLLLLLILLLFLSVLILQILAYCPSIYSCLLLQWYICKHAQNRKKLPFCHTARLSLLLVWSSGSSLQFYFVFQNEQNNVQILVQLWYRMWG